MLISEEVRKQMESAQGSRDRLMTTLFVTICGSSLSTVFFAAGFTLNKLHLPDVLLGTITPCIEHPELISQFKADVETASRMVTLGNTLVLAAGIIMTITIAGATLLLTSEHIKKVVEKYRV